jgi:hypothetical protein
LSEGARASRLAGDGRDEPADSSAQCVAASVRRYGHARATLLSWMHDSWREPELAALAELPAGVSDSSSFTTAQARCADAWLDHIGVGTPPLDAFNCHAGQLFLLPHDAMLSAIRLRALYFRRAELRYWVGRESRGALSAQLGIDATAILRWLMSTPGAPPVDQLMRVHRMPPLDQLDADALGWEGYCLFARAGWCAAPLPLALLRFAWDSEQVVPVWVRDRRAGVPDDEVQVVRRSLEFLQGVKERQTC